MTVFPRLLRLLAWTLICIALLGVLGWLQQGDPDCLLDTSLFAQIRLCDAAYVGMAQGQSPWLLALYALMLLGGLGLLKLARRKKP